MRLGQHRWEKATVSKNLNHRKYTVTTTTGDFTRNRKHLRKSNETDTAPVKQPIEQIIMPPKPKIEQTPKAKTPKQSPSKIPRRSTRIRRPPDFYQAS